METDAKNEGAADLLLPPPQLLLNLKARADPLRLRRSAACDVAKL
jgi:hypothetical protein